MTAQPSLFDETPSKAPPEAPGPNTAPRPSEAATAPPRRQSRRTEPAGDGWSWDAWEPIHAEAARRREEQPDGWIRWELE